MDLAAIVVIQVLYGVASLVIVSAGLAVIFGMMKVINLAHGEFMMLGAYATLGALKIGINLWIAIFVVGLVFTAMALAVAFATRGAMAGSRHIVEVLHFVGAEDRFIAREFQRLFLRLGLKGGAIGGLCALALFLASRVLSNVWALSPGGDQIEALFGSFSLGPKGYALIGLIAFAIAILTGYMSRVVVFRHLGALE